MNFLIVFLGAGVGGAIRHGINLATARLLPGVTFPVATLFINVLGSFLKGIIAESFVLRGSGGHPLRLLLTTGVLGGFTTFSTFSLWGPCSPEEARLVRAGRSTRSFVRW